MGLEDAFGSDPEPTELQSKILEIAERNPDMTTSQIADTLDCSASYVSETFQTFNDPRDKDSGGLGDLLG